MVGKKVSLEECLFMMCIFFGFSAHFCDEEKHFSRAVSNFGLLSFPLSLIGPFYHLTRAYQGLSKIAYIRNCLLGRCYPIVLSHSIGSAAITNQVTANIMIASWAFNREACRNGFGS